MTTKIELENIERHEIECHYVSSGNNLQQNEIGVEIDINGRRIVLILKPDHAEQMKIGLEINLLRLKERQQ